MAQKKPTRSAPEFVCSGPECTRLADGAGGLCFAHYQQQRRNQDLRKLREVGDRTRFTFRCTTELRDAAEADAHARGIEISEWWRLAGLAMLNRGGK
jgi:hypothetical protein